MSGHSTAMTAYDKIFGPTINFMKKMFLGEEEDVGEIGLCSHINKKSDNSSSNGFALQGDEMESEDASFTKCDC